jgi:acetylornithine/N-succinyldiaminopimelate aminotransferase
MNQRQLFLSHVGQTSPTPLAINMVRAEGCRLWDDSGKSYIDLIAGISVSNLGHGHPQVVKAVQEQAAKYMHLMVYGELVVSPQVAFARAITDLLPPGLDVVYYTTSGSEATEGAMKLAKRYTGRTQIVSFKNSYHGSTQGALSIMGSKYWQQAFRPLLPDVLQLRYNVMEDLAQITTATAAVFAETIQAEMGVLVPDREWLQALRRRCTETGTLLVLDEIQCGFGRNGSLWAFTPFEVVPDILLLAKAMGGGMPIGAFVSSATLMKSLTHNPVLGHINTFGGHPVCCAAGLAALQVLLAENYIAQVAQKEQLFLECLSGLRVRSHGLMMSVVYDNAATCQKIIRELLNEGVFTDWFLFAPHCLRIAPPLTISEAEIREACAAIQQVSRRYEAVLQ